MMIPKFLSKQSVLSIGEINEIQSNLKEKNKFKLTESAHINILILGKVGVGKSSFFNCLKDPTIEAIKQSLTAVTQHAILQPFTIIIGNDYFTINLVDTPGLREYGKNARSDVKITESIIECIERDITKLHILLICVSTTERFTNDDFIAIRTLVENFCVDNKLAILICITKSENKPEKWFEDRIKEIEEHEFFIYLKEEKNKIYYLFYRLC